jgi:adenylate cyclase
MEISDRGPAMLSTPLIKAAVQSQSVEGFLTAAGVMLSTPPLRVERIFLSLQTLHPAFRARTYLWKREGQSVSAIEWPHGLRNRPGYYHSPDYHVHTAGTEFRVPNLQEMSRHPCDLYGKLKAEGYTDYLMVPLAFSDGTVNTLSISTRAPGGLSSEALDRFRALIDLFVVVVERYAALETRNAALDTYLGRSAAAQILSGNIRSGHGEATDAAILFADLHNFTGQSAKLSATGTVRLLNAYFDCLVGPIEEHGGYVLKFIGDAILAFFPILSDAAEPNPIDAILTIRNRLEELNQARSESGEPALGHALCAHFGRVLYGNVGSSERLDFTIIGESVNIAARGVSTAKLLGTDYVFTRSFIQRFTGNAFVPIGRHAFKGIAEPQELFTVAACPE